MTPPKGMSSPWTNTTGYRRKARLAVTEIHAKAWRKDAKTAGSQTERCVKLVENFFVDATNHLK
jgi:hypothetical protein